MSPATTAPQSSIDLWTEEALLDPYPLWRELRDAGAAVHLPQYDLWALARYADVRAALADWQVFTSSRGVTLNDTMNGLLEGITLATDPPEHQQLRDVLKKPLVPRETRLLEDEMREEARTAVEESVAQGTFDAMALARHLPMRIVSTRVGLPEEGREQMLDWAFANFQCFGPMNDRTRAALPVLEGAMEYAMDPTLKERLTPGGWAANLWDAADAGEIPHEKCPVMLNDYWGPSLDTTTFGLASAIWLFAEHPDQWDLLREDPSLVTHAINEVIRHQSPISQFSRVTTRDHEVDGITIPAGARVMVMYGSANRDERKWEDPERFDIRRRPSDHLGFGHGEHQCVGQPLGRLELRVALEALLERVERFEVVAMARALNNTLRGMSRLDVRVT